MRALLRVMLPGLVVASLSQARARAEPAAEADQASQQLASQYVNAGLAAQDAGDHDRAIVLYTKAFHVRAHPVLLFDLAQAHRLAGHSERAIRLYTRYLEVDPGGAQAPTARELLAELKQREAEAGKRKPADEAREAASDDRRTARPQARKPAADGAREFDRRKASDDSRGMDAALVNGEREAERDGHRAATDDRDNARGERTAAGDKRQAVGADRDREAGDRTAPRRARTADREAAPVGEADSGSAENQDKRPARGAGPATQPRSAAWKWGLGVNAGVGTAAAAFAYYSGVKMRDEGAKLHTAVSERDCGGHPVFTDPSDRRAFDSACSWRSRQLVGLAVVGVTLAGATVATIALIRDPGPADTAAHPRAKSELTIAPIVVPSGGGAALSLTW